MVEYAKKPVVQQSLNLTICSICWCMSLPQFMNQHMEFHAKKGETASKPGERPLIVQPGGFKP